MRSVSDAFAGNGNGNGNGNSIGFRIPLPLNALNTHLRLLTRLLIDDQLQPQPHIFPLRYTQVESSRLSVDTRFWYVLPRVSPSPHPPNPQLLHRHPPSHPLHRRADVARWSVVRGCTAGGVSASHYDYGFAGSGAHL
jgi:hypothetical protein